MLYAVLARPFGFGNVRCLEFKYSLFILIFFAALLTVTPRPTVNLAQNTACASRGAARGTALPPHVLREDEKVPSRSYVKRACNASLWRCSRGKTLLAK